MKQPHLTVRVFATYPVNTVNYQVAVVAVLNLITMLKPGKTLLIIEPCPTSQLKIGDYRPFPQQPKSAIATQSRLLQF